MKVSELFQKLSFGEFSNLSIGNDGAGDIVVGKKPKILHYTNEALLRLYSRFILREADCLIEQQEWIRFYKLSPEFALSNPTPGDTTLYIIDTEDKPFVEDVIKILGVYGSDGCELPLNDRQNPYSVFTPQADVVQVPNPVQGSPLGVLYQARHVELKAYTDDIVLPATLNRALTSYIAYLTYSHMNGQENAAKANEHMQIYEAICNEAEQMGLVGDSHATTNTRFANGGWI